MKLSSMVQENLILLKESVSSKNEAIEKLLKRLEKEYYSNLDFNSVKNKILERESLGSTTYENGLAIPHARIDEVDGVVIGILTPKEPFIDNGIVVNMVLMIVSSSSSSSIYLKILSSLVTLLDTTQKVEFFSSISKVDEFIEKIKKNDITLSSELKIKDILNKEFPKLLPETTVGQAIGTMSKTNIACLPICQEDGTYEGVVHFNDIISIGIPQYAQMLTSMKFVSSIDPMEQLFINEDKILVKDIMNKKEITVESDNYLLEVLLLMIKEKKLFIPVIEDKKCVGVIDYTCLINNYLRV